MAPDPNIDEEKLSEQLQRLLKSIEASGRAVLPGSNDALLKSIVETAARIFGAADGFFIAGPHCWRCHNPVVFRATDQWFLALDKGDLRATALREIDRVRWIPRWGRDRIYNMIENRPDWCLSRQRTWGVPIPVFYCEGCDEPLVSPALMEKVAQAFEAEGIEAWYRRTPASFTEGHACPRCGKTAFGREQDILDVWWDSGASWLAVAEREGMGVPVALYLEGSDQHRGWFHC